MEDILELLDKAKEKLANLSMEDVFPLMRKYNIDDVKELCISVGIYLGAIIFFVIVIFALGWIPVLGIIMKIISFIVITYATVGIFASLLTYMKYN